MKIEIEKTKRWENDVTKIKFESVILLNGLELFYFMNELNTKRIRSAIKTIAIYLNSKGLNKFLREGDAYIIQELAETLIFNNYFDSDKFMSKSKEEMIKDSKMMADVIIDEYRALHKPGARIGDKIMIDSYSPRYCGFYDILVNPERVPREEDNYEIPEGKEEVEE